MTAHRIYALTLCLLSSALAQRDCIGAGNSAFDSWCQDNCNHDPPFCPSTFCSCTDEAPIRLSCRAVGRFSGLNDQWCDDNCNHVPSFCPPSFCECGDSSPVPEDPLDIRPFEAPCCEESADVLFVASGHQILRLDSIDDVSPEVCYEVGGQIASIVFDNEGSMYFSDHVGAALYRASTNCDNSTVEMITSWENDGRIDRPTGLAIIPGRSLVVSNTIGLFEVRFSNDNSVYSISELGNITENVQNIVYHDGYLYIIYRRAAIYVFDPETEEVSPFLNIHDLNIPDYGGVTINECGLFFTATDANQVFFCPDLTNPNSCQLYCLPDINVDGTSCINIVNPIGIISGCCCDVYVASAGTGCVVRLSSGGLAPPLVAENIVCNLIDTQTSAFYQSPTQGSCTPRTCDVPITTTNIPTPSPEVPSTAPSIAQTVSPSPTLSASSSLSPTPSPTRRLGRLVPGVNLQGSGGFTQAGILTGTATIELIICDVGEPLFECFPNNSDSNHFLIPANKLSTVSQEDEPFRAVNIPVFIQAISKQGTGFTGSSFSPSCMFHVVPILRTNETEVVCGENCFTNPSIGQPRLFSQCPSGLGNVDPRGARNRARDAMNEVANILGLDWNAFGTTNGDPNVPASLFQSANTDICENDVIAEFSVSLLQLQTGQPIQITIISQPRFGTSQRCDPTKTRAERLCFDTTPYRDTLFNGIDIGDENGFVCIREFLVEGDGTSTSLQPAGFQAPDTILKIITDDILDTSFSVSARSSGCPDSIPSTLCAASPRRLCYIDECPSQ